jgi:hypothetical protein
MVCYSIRLLMENGLAHVCNLLRLLVIVSRRSLWRRCTCSSESWRRDIVGRHRRWLGISIDGNNRDMWGGGKLHGRVREGYSRSCRSPLPAMLFLLDHVPQIVLEDRMS